MPNYVTVTESARKVRAALRAAFPKVKISVTSGGSMINFEWEDTGPAVEELEEALKAAGFAELVERHGYGADYLTVDGHHLWFNCYNTAHREAAQRDMERRRQDWEAQKKRGQEAVDQARKAKRDRQAAVPFQRQAQSTIIG